MAKNYFNRYVWLINTIKDFGPITFDEINRKWMDNRALNEYGEALSLRTFHHHCKVIDDMFELKIVYHKPDGYSLQDDGVKGQARGWMLDALSVAGVLRESEGAMPDRILLEDVPSGKTYLTQILKAMKTYSELSITYENYASGQTFTAVVEPYFLKMFKLRWYMIAQTAEGLRIYALDRINDLKYTGKKFKMPRNFTAKEMFSDYYGIVVDDDFQPCRILIKAYDGQQKYFESKPLHWSQDKYDEADEWMIFKYFMAPSWDLEMELLQYHSRVEVLEPQSLRDKVLALAKATVERYEKKAE